jgi:hypothetical protein
MRVYCVCNTVREARAGPALGGTAVEDVMTGGTVKTGGTLNWPDLGSQNERLVVPLDDQDERLVDPQAARQAGLPLAARPLVPRSRAAADDEPAGGPAESGEPGQRGWSGLRRLRRSRSVAAAA